MDSTVTARRPEPLVNAAELPARTRALVSRAAHAIQAAELATERLEDLRARFWSIVTDGALERAYRRDDADILSIRACAMEWAEARSDDRVDVSLGRKSA